MKTARNKGEGNSLHGQLSLTFWGICPLCFLMCKRPMQAKVITFVQKYNQSSLLHFILTFLHIELVHLVNFFENGCYISVVHSVLLDRI